MFIAPHETAKSWISSSDVFSFPHPRASISRGYLLYTTFSLSQSSSFRNLVCITSLVRRVCVCLAGIASRSMNCQRVAATVVARRCRQLGESLTVIASSLSHCLVMAFKRIRTARYRIKVSQGETTPSRRPLEDDNGDSTRRQRKCVDFRGAFL